MNTNTSSPAGVSRSAHRWIFALPIVIVLVVLTLREGMGVMKHRSTAQVPLHVVADAGALYDVDEYRIQLRAGGVQVSSPGFLTLAAGEWNVSAWGGTVYVVKTQGSATVVAFDVPVLVQGDYGIAVVPPMRQWTLPTMPIPDPSSDPDMWIAATETAVVPAAFAKQRSIERYEYDEVPLLPGNLVDADAARFSVYALGAEQTRSLAAALRLHPELRTYALVHPAVRDVSWAYRPDSAVVDSETWAALLSLPALERDAASVSSLTVRRWGETLRVAFESSQDPDARKSAVVPILEAHINRAAGEGHPMRALRFAEALRNAVGTGAVLDTPAADAFARILTMTPESLRASVLAPKAAPAPAALDMPAPPSPDVVADPTLETRVREILAARGAMFTADSSVRTVAAGSVEVHDVVFGFPSGDRAVRFQYRLEDDTVRAIADGTVQPYAVPFQAYMDWEAGR